MTKWALFFILLWLATFVTGQLLFKRAMELSRKLGFRHRQTISTLGIGILVMTTSFCLNLGLLQRFDLSYLYPFQGSSIIIISLLAAIILKERLTPRLIIGTLLITAGVVFVSMS
jgi:drug/metabolite transporter (DMT)-like permease